MTEPLFALPAGKHQLETSSVLTPRFDDKGLVTAIVSDHITGELLMVAHMNDEALHKTITSGQSHFWSRSRGELWHKGATSGTVQMVKEIRTDCDQDAIWLKVEVKGAGATCHTGMKGCFYRRVDLAGDKFGLVHDDHKPLFNAEEIYGNNT